MTSVEGRASTGVYTLHMRVATQGPADSFISPWTGMV